MALVVLLLIAGAKPIKYLHYGFSLLLVETNTQESQMVNIVRYSFMSGRIGDQDKERLFILP